MLKSLAKRIGRLFVILTDEHRSIDPQQVKQVLIVGSGGRAHLGAAIRNAITRFEPGRVTVLTSAEKESFLQSEFPDVECIILYGKIGRFALARQVLRHRKENYDLIITMSLDVFVNMSALCFSNSVLILYNEWNHWYLIRFKRLREFIGLVKQTSVRSHKKVRIIWWLLSRLFIGISRLIYYFFAYIYLLIAVIFILLKRQYRVFGNRFFSKRTGDG